MAGKKRSDRAFAVFITVLVILLILAMALFVYGSMTNGLPKPHLPGQHPLAWGTMPHHG